MKNNLANLKKNGYLYYPNFYNNHLIEKAKNEFLFNERDVLDKVKSLNSYKTSKKHDYAIEKKSFKYLKHSNFWFSHLNFLINKSLFDTMNKLTNFDFYFDRMELHQKKPGVSITPPHQDNFYFGLDLKKNYALTAYIALNDQDGDMGGLGFYPGSNHKNYKHHSSKIIGFSSGINEKDLKDEKPFNPILKAGDLIIHHCNIVHYAKKNITDLTRMNIAIRILPSNPISDEKLKKIYATFREKSKRD